MSATSSSSTVQFVAASRHLASLSVLKMPTIQRVIKIQHKPTVAAAAAAGIITRHHQQLDQQSDQKIPFSSVPGTPAHAPPILEKTCGLFDIDNNPFDTENDNKSDALDMENMSIPLDQLLHLEEPPLTPVKKSFSEKINQANLKIKITKPVADTMNSYEATSELDLNLDDVDLNNIMTPTTEHMCMQYLHTIQTDEAAQQQQQQLKTASPVFNNAQILASYSLVETDVLALNTPSVTASTDHAINPFLSQQSGNVNFSNAAAPSAASSIVSYDHQYSAASTSAAAAAAAAIVQNKRPRLSSSVFGDDDTSSTFSLDSSFASAADSSQAKKKQRTRGIYRYDDVSTEEDLKNYLERRKKNNISSKVSRANKKNYYTEMDSHMDSLERQNTQLEAKAKKLEQINKMMKDYLIENFAKSSSSVAASMGDK